MAGGATKKASETERLLGEILDKLTMFNLVIKFDFKVSMLKDIEKNSSDVRPIQESLNSEILKLTDAIGNINYQPSIDQVHTSTPEWMIELNDSYLEKEAFRKRKQLWNIWRKCLNDRKQSYWNAFKCDKYVETYSHWISKESPILPRKYLIKEIKGESEEENKLRWDLAISSFQTDISIIQSKQVRYKQKYIALDSEMMEEIRRISTGKITEKMNEMWIRDISKEEEKSRKIWQGKEKFLEKYAEQYGKEPLQEVNREKPQNGKRRIQKQRHRPTSKNTEQQNRQYGKTSRSTSKPRRNATPNTQRKSSQSRSRESKKSYSDAVRSGLPQNRNTSRQGWRQASNKKKNAQPNRIQGPTRSKNNEIRNNNYRPRYGQNRDKYSQRYGQNTDNYRQSNQRRIHFLVSGQKTPEREKIQEETSVNQT